MANILRWIHLSDLHMQSPMPDGMRPVLDALWKDIPQQIELLGGPLDFIAFTGDVAHSGKADEYVLAEEHFFRPLLKVTGVSSSKLFIVPGNHDVNRDWQVLINPDSITSLRSSDQVAAILGDDSRRRLIFGSMENYRDFVHHLLDQPSCRPLVKDPSYSYGCAFQKQSVSVVILGLNSAWASGFAADGNGRITDEGNLVVGEQQIVDAIKTVPRADLTVVLMHHPLSWLKEFDVHGLTERISPKQTILLGSHVHDSDGPSMYPTMERFVTAISAGESASDGRISFEYNIVDIDLDSGSGSVIRSQCIQRRSARPRPSPPKFAQEATSIRLPVAPNPRSQSIGPTLPEQPGPTPRWWLLGREAELTRAENFLDQQLSDEFWVTGKPGSGASEFLQVIWRVLDARGVSVLFCDGKDDQCGLPVDQYYFVDKLQRWLGSDVSAASGSHFDTTNFIHMLLDKTKTRQQAFERPLVVMFSNFEALAPAIQRWVRNDLWPLLRRWYGSNTTKAFFSYEAPLSVEDVAVSSVHLHLGGLTLQDVERFLYGLEFADVPSLASHVYAADSGSLVMSASRLYENMRIFFAEQAGASDVLFAA
jgi:hypothetical protein